MPGYLVHQGATVLCAHGGQAQPTAPNPRVKVGEQQVVTQPVTYTVTGCPFTLPNGTSFPCVTAQWVTAATKIMVGGVPAVLQDSQAICVPTGTPLTVVVTQLRTKGT
jgi:hypothetical protein